MMEGRKNISCIWATAPSGNIPAVSEILSMSSTPAQDRARSEYEKIRNSEKAHWLILKGLT